MKTGNSNAEMYSPPMASVHTQSPSTGFRLSAIVQHASKG
jgi:hypothetical protein